MWRRFENWCIAYWRELYFSVLIAVLVLDCKFMISAVLNNRWMHAAVIYCCAMMVLCSLIRHIYRNL